MVGAMGRDSSMVERQRRWLWDEEGREEKGPSTPQPHTGASQPGRGGRILLWLPGKPGSTTAKPRGHRCKGSAGGWTGSTLVKNVPPSLFFFLILLVNRKLGFYFTPNLCRKCLFL